MTRKSLSKIINTPGLQKWEFKHSEDKKLLIQSIESFNTQEQAALAEELEIRDLDSFSSVIDFSCSEFLFFSDVIFFNTTFTNISSFEESIFTGNVKFVNSDFPEIANFWGVTFIKPYFFRDVTFGEYSLVNTVPFVSSIKPAVAAYQEVHLAIPTIYIQLFAVLQSVISATLSFLTGLALKHKFSIK